MQLPNWAKIIWWLLLVGSLSFFLRERLPDLLAGKTGAADIAVFGVWMALLLAPLFSEVTLLGVTLKNEIEELKGQIAAQIADVRADIRSAIDVRATVSPTINFPSPPADAQLPALEQQVKAAVAAALAEHGRPLTPPRDMHVSDDVQFLFATRYHLESELRRLATRTQVGMASRRPQPVFVLSRALVEAGLLDARLGNAIREVYSVCSPAIHGEAVTEASVFCAGCGSRVGRRASRHPKRRARPDGGGTVSASPFNWSWSNRSVDSGTFRQGAARRRWISCLAAPYRNVPVTFTLLALKGGRMGFASNQWLHRGQGLRRERHGQAHSG